MPPQLHDLKSWTGGPFAELWHGRRAFDVRRNDRRYAAGDVVMLREWDPGLDSAQQGYTGREILALVTIVWNAWHLAGLNAAHVPTVVLGIDVRSRCSPAREGDPRILHSVTAEQLLTGLT